VTPVRAAPARGLGGPALPANAERALLVLMLQSDAWRARVLEKVDPEEIEHPLYRAVFEAVAEGRHEQLEEAAARLYESLRASGAGEGADALFEQAVNRIEARRLDRELERLEREIPLTSGAEQERLVRDVQRVSAERNKLFPRYKIVPRRSGAPGT
jgi:replicative DNA helicase